jgi:dTDP-4-amino-4,6-dideoxygalactose transaminase
VDRDSGNVTVESIERVISPRTRAIIPVHLGGWPCDMDGIMSLAESRDIKVLEDCAQAHGAAVSGRPVGSIGHASAFSFCQDKIITTGGEGGLLATDDEETWLSAWAFKDHGKDYKAVYEPHQAPGFKWLHGSFGTNWRMTEVQAAIGRIQLRKLGKWSDRRRANAQVLIDALKGVPALRIPEPPPHLRHAYYRFYAYVKPEALRSTWNRDRLIADVSANGVPCFSGSCSEIYREQAFVGTRFAPSATLAGARELGETSIALLVHPTLDSRHMLRAAEVLSSSLERAMR